MRKPHQVEFIARRRFEEIPQNISRVLRQVQLEFDDTEMIRPETVRRVAELLNVDINDTPFFIDSSADDIVGEIIKEIDEYDETLELTDLSDKLAAFRREIRVVDSYMDYLRMLEVDDFLALYRTEFVLHKKKEEELAAIRDRFAFFHEPNADADFRLWLEASSWTIEESVALSLGKNPHIVNSSELTRYDDPVSPFRDEYQRRLWLVTRASEANELSESRFSPREFIAWAASKSIKLPSELSSFIADNTNSSDSNSSRDLRADGERPLVDIEGLKLTLTKTQEELTDSQNTLRLLNGEIDTLNRQIDELNFMNKIAPKSKTSLYNILVGIAASCFGYGGPTRSGAARHIETLLDDLAMNYAPVEDKFAKNNPNDVRVDEETILKWLDQAKEHTGFNLRRPIPPITRTSLPPTDS